jgi:flagellin
MTIINTNISAITAQNAVTRNQKSLAVAMERLSTGKRINTGADDPAGLAIGARMESTSRSALQGVRNANDAISMLQTISSAGQHIVDIFIKMKELAVQSSTDTLSARDRVTLDNEYFELGREVMRIYTNTRWNNFQTMLIGAAAGTTAGANVTIRLDGGAAGNQMVMNFKEWDFAGTTATTNVYGFDNTAAADNHVGRFDFPAARNTRTNALGVATSKANSNIDTITSANNAITMLDTAITGASAELAQYGAYTNRLEFSIENLTAISMAADESRSRIEDADYAKETSNLSRTQIMAQAATAMLAQANAAQQTVLTLLQ